MFGQSLLQNSIIFKTSSNNVSMHNYSTYILPKTNGEVNKPKWIIHHRWRATQGCRFSPHCILGHGFNFKTTSRCKRIDPSQYYAGLHRINTSEKSNGNSSKIEPSRRSRIQTVYKVNFIGLDSQCALRSSKLQVESIDLGAWSSWCSILHHL